MSAWHWANVKPRQTINLKPDTQVRQISTCEFMPKEPLWIQGAKARGDKVLSRRDSSG